MCWEIRARARFAAFCGSDLGLGLELGLPRDADSRSSERDTNANRDPNPKPEATGARVVCWETRTRAHAFAAFSWFRILG